MPFLLGSFYRNICNRTLGRSGSTTKTTVDKSLSTKFTIILELLFSLYRLLIVHPRIMSLLWVKRPFFSGHFGGYCKKMCPKCPRLTAGSWSFVVLDLWWRSKKVWITYSTYWCLAFRINDNLKTLIFCLHLRCAALPTIQSKFLLSFILLKTCSNLRNVLGNWNKINEILINKCI